MKLSIHLSDNTGKPVKKFMLHEKWKYKTNTYS